MSRKIHRHRYSSFNNRKQRMFKTIGKTAAALLIIPVGFFTAKYMMENFKTTDKPDTNSVVSSESSSTEEPAVSQTEPAETPASAAQSSGLRAFYLPVSQLANTAALDSQLDAASQAGFNAVLFDLKDENGILHYASATELAQKSQAAASDALTPDALKSAVQHLTEKGFTAVPRLFAFKDPLAPPRLASAKVMLEGDASCTWLDSSREKGGKPWLNPYSPDAHRYIVDMAKELSDMGFSAVMLDGVQFPNKTHRAYYGKTELSSLSQSAVLQKFVGEVSSAVGENCRVMLTMPGLSAFGDGTAPFGGNPVTFGAGTVSPMLMPAELGNKLGSGDNILENPKSKPYEAVKLAVGQVNLRLELVDQSEHPTMMPWLQGYDYTSEQMLQQIRAVSELLGKDASYILYNQDGTYDFSALKQ